jgi:hypothetical protein
VSQAQTQSIPKDKFLRMAANLLHKTLLEVPRTQAKNAFKELSQGRPFHLATVKMEDESTVRFSVNLDYTEFNGKLNFGAFRTSLVLLVSNLGQILVDNKEFTVFSEETDPDVMIFGVTAVTREADNINIMVLGADIRDGKPSVLLRLLYIDDSQFLEPKTAGETPQEQSA